MTFVGLTLLAQLALPAQGSLPVLAFPEPGIDDRASYQSYQTRFYRDDAGNTVQIYIEGSSGRVVHLLADADDESVAFSVRQLDGDPATLEWKSPGARTFPVPGMRAIEYTLEAHQPAVRIGLFLLGSMRVERDFQYAGRQRNVFGGAYFRLPEMERMLQAMAALPQPERQRQAGLLGASNVAELRQRLVPRFSIIRNDSSWVAHVVQLSLDARDSLALEIRVDPRRVAASGNPDSVSLTARDGGRVQFSVRVATSARPLTPLAREEIFTAEFLRYLAAARAAADSAPATAAGNKARLRARRQERQVRGVELLASREKLMAGLPAYATYFGRDMLVSALMMRPIWRAEMSEFAIASVLRKLSSAGQVSHEEALGGQTDREAAGDYVRLLDAYAAAHHAGHARAADSLLADARSVLRDHRRVRENYHMIDDELQFPVLVTRWLEDPRITADAKRAFLMDASDSGEPRLAQLVRELGLVARMTDAYAKNPVAMNLVSFAPRDSGRWQSASWRDSGAGYAGGRFAMDVNALWAPHALDAVSRILGRLRALGVLGDSASGTMPDLAAGTPLGGYARDSAGLRRAVDNWLGASRHFVVRLAPADVRARVAARLAAMPREERSYWSGVLASTHVDADTLSFLALSLDAAGHPIAVANTDPATGLFLGDPGATDTAALLRDVRLFVLPYPVGLLIDGVGPVVSNDAYAPPGVWGAFERDKYHGPRVVWGREVNLFLLGLAQRIARDPEVAYAGELRAALDQVRSAVEASGFHSELWSYEVRDGRVLPVRYGSGSDVQLWSTTDLAVQFALDQITSLSEAPRR